MLPEIYTIPAKPRLGALPILSLSSYDTRAGIFLDDFFPKAKGITRKEEICFGRHWKTHKGVLQIPRSMQR